MRLAEETVMESRVREYLSDNGFVNSVENRCKWISGEHAMTAYVFFDHADFYKDGQCKTVVYKHAPLPNVSDMQGKDWMDVQGSIRRLLDDWDKVTKNTVNL